MTNSQKKKVKGVGYRQDTGKWFYRSRGRNKRLVFDVNNTNKKFIER